MADATLKDVLDALNALNKNLNKKDGGTNTSTSINSSDLTGSDEITQFKEIQSIKKEINEDSEEYFRLLKKIKYINKEIKRQNKELVKINEEQKKLELEEIKLQNELMMANETEKAIIIERLELLEEEKKVLEKKGEILEKNISHLTEEVKILGKTVKEARSFKIFMSSAAKDVSSIYNGIKSSYDFLRSNDAFKFQKAIRTSALQMGLVGQGSELLNQRIQSIANNTVDFGYDIEKVAELQSSYSDELGRAVILGKDAGDQLSAMASATGLGSEGAGQLAASLDSVGFSAQKTAEYIEQVVNDSSSMGLNATKVVKNISSNIKLLNKYNFKGGIKGLQKMAETTTKMGVGMEMVSGMAEKLFDIEGAVEMSAQLQVMGGEWAKLGDPFKLMYMARNDIAGLTESVINATKATATFNAETGEFDISGLEMQRLRKVAEATGLNYEELAQSAKKAAQFAEIDAQIGFRVDDKEMKDFIENTAILGKDKKATIEVNGSPKLLSQIDKSTIKSLMGEKKTLAERAKAAQSFEDKITNLVTQFKQLLVPLVDALDKGLSPVIAKISDTLKDPKTFDAIKKFAESVGNLIGAVGKFMFEHPVWSLALFGVFEAAKWYANGLALGAGFNSVAGMAGGRGATSFLTGGLSKTGKLFGKGAGAGAGAAAGLGLGIGGTLLNSYVDENTKKGSGWNIAGKMGSRAMQGAGFGTLFGPWGMAIGGALGGLYGLYESLSEDEEKTSKEVIKTDDGVIFNPKDKFMKVNDGTMIAGTNENGNRELAKAITNNYIDGGYAPLLKNKEVLNKKETVNYVVESSAPGNVNVGFDELKLGGRIELGINGTMTTELGKQLLQNQAFIRDISKLINMATNSAINGKVK